MVPSAEVQGRYADVLEPSQVTALNLLFALRACVQGIDTAVGHWLGPDALSPGRFQILVTLWSAAAPIAQRDIVKRLEVTRATISGLIATLEHDGLVTTAADPSDKRKLLVTLTADGSTLIERVVGQTSNKLRSAFSGLDNHELQTLTGLIDRLADSVSRLSSRQRHPTAPSTATMRDRRAGNDADH